MNINASTNKNGIDSKQLLHLWKNYILLDMAVFTILFHLHRVYINDNSSIALYEIQHVLLYPITLLIFKLIVIPQYPMMLLGMFMLRKKHAHRWLLWICTPVLAFIVSYVLFFGLSIALEFNGGLDFAERALRREWQNWIRPVTPLSASRPMSFMSGVIAAVFWNYFLREKLFKS